MPYLFVVYYSVAKLLLYSIQGGKTIYFPIIEGGQVRTLVTWVSHYFITYNTIPSINTSNFKKKKRLYNINAVPFFLAFEGLLLCSLKMITLSWSFSIESCLDTL